MLNKLLSRNSPLVRRILGQVYREGRTYRVPLGPFKGFNLVYRRAINFHAMLGLWEMDSMAVLAQLLKSPAFPRVSGLVLDVGANIGLYSLWLARHMAPQGQVISFEPAPETRSMLTETLAANAQRNIRIEAQAAADVSGTVDFFVGAHHHQSSLDADWAASGGTACKIAVPAIALDDFYAGLGDPRPVQFLKMDIEGGGVVALRGCRAIFQKQRPFAIIESHNPAEDGAISNVLTSHDYVGFRVNSRKWISKPAATHPDPEGVWGTMLLVPKEKRDVLQW